LPATIDFYWRDQQSSLEMPKVCRISFNAQNETSTTGLLKIKNYDFFSSNPHKSLAISLKWLIFAWQSAIQLL
jgi:hypothetical protein